MSDEKIVEVERLITFKNHPFKVGEDKEMSLLKDSIEKYGILNPIIVRPTSDGVYEIISGHRRKYAAEMLWHRKVPVIIRVLDDNEFVIQMFTNNYCLRQIADEYLLFPIEDMADKLNGTIVLNELSQHVWMGLKNPMTLEEMVLDICNIYDVTSEIAEKDLKKLLDQFLEFKVINELQ